MTSHKHVIDIPKLEREKIQSDVKMFMAFQTTVEIKEI